MDSLHLPLTLVDESAFSTVRLRVRMLPDVVTDLTVPAQTYLTCADLVSALNNAFGAILNGGRVELGDDGRITFQAFALFCFDIGDSAEEAALITPLLHLLGFDPNDCTDMSFLLRAAERPVQMWSWPVIGVCEPNRLDVTAHSANGLHGGRCGVYLGAAEIETVRLEFLDERAVVDWRRFVDDMLRAQTVSVFRTGELVYRAQPVVDDKRLEAALGRAVTRRPPYWSVRLTLMREVKP